MALCRTQDVPSLHYGTWLLSSWGLAALLGLLLHVAGRKAGRSGWMAAGIALLSVPAWMELLLVAPDLAKTFCVEGNVAAVVSAHGTPALPGRDAFLAQAADALQRNVGYPLAGLLLYLHGRQVQGRLAPTWREKLQDLAPMGRGLAPSFALGCAFFPILALANVAMVYALGLDIRATGGSAYYSNMDAPAAVLLALAAGLGEEIVFRGVMQQGFKRLLAPHLGRRPATAVAVALQAIPFAYAHAGYGNPTLLLFNAGFAILAGLVVETAGLGAAIALHALIDFAAFLLSAAHPDWLLWTTAVLVAAGVLAAAGNELRRFTRARPTG